MVGNHDNDPLMLTCMTICKGKAHGHAYSVVWLPVLDGLTDVDLRERLERSAACLATCS